MAEEKKGLAGIFNDPNFITGMSVLAANSDPRRHWSEGYQDASQRLSAMERSALARAEIEMRKQKFEQERKAIEQKQAAASALRERLVGAESPAEVGRALMELGQGGQVSTGAQLYGQTMRGAEADTTDLLTEYNVYRQQAEDFGEQPMSFLGYQQKLAEIERSGKVSPSLKTAMDPKTGLRFYIDQFGRPVTGESGMPVAAPGGPQEKLIEQQTSKEFSWPETSRVYESRERGFDQSLSAINEVRRVLDKAGPIPVTGAGSFLSRVPETRAKDLRSKIETVIARIGFEELQNMRENAPGGGSSGLGQVTEREIALLQSVLANLDQSQSEEEFRINLARVEEQIASSKAAIQKEYEEDLRRFGPSAMPAQQSAGGSVDDLVNKYLNQNRGR